MKNTIIAAALLCSASLLANENCLADGPVNVDASGVAIMGYDPVAYFVDGKPEKGGAQFQSTYQGATYDFASSEHKALFDQEPAKYAPEFGGFCAFGLSHGHEAKIDPTAFQIVDGKLLLQYNSQVLATFNQDQAGNLKKAEESWSALIKKPAN